MRLGQQEYIVPINLIITWYEMCRTLLSLSANWYNYYNDIIALLIKGKTQMEDQLISQHARTEMLTLVMD